MHFILAATQYFFNLRYVRYTGSFTTPGCTENVKWVAMANYCEVPPSFLTFTSGYASMNNNYRAVQPLNGRDIDLGCGGKIYFFV